MKNRKRFVSILAGLMAALMILTLILSLLPTRASAASSSEIRKQINELKNQKKEIQAQIEDLKDQYQKNENEIADIVARKNIIDQEIGLLHAQITNITEQISAFSVLVADKQDELDNAQTRFEQMNEDCKVRIRAMEEEGSLTYWEVLFRATSFSNLLDRLTMVEEIAASDIRRLQELSDAADAVEVSRQELALEKEELDATKAELDATQAQLDEKREEADALIQELLSHAEELEELREQKEKEDEELMAHIAEMEQAYNRAKEEEWLAYIATATTAAPTTQPGGGDGGIDFGNGGGSNNSGGNNNAGSTSWIRPCNYVKVTSPYGFREQPTAGASRFHQGIDLGAPAGTTIVASRAGTVTSAGYSNSLGWYVTINHGDGFSSMYGHMLGPAYVSSGSYVSQGQSIGGVGSTGISTGNHLHFAILYNGAYQNPAAYVAFY
ncbi:MAG: peptidoglycan DD-metalloendopeptidase family protein [Clostridiales bacterium]|nr:peptidoglycan DD-metalloendopeptidase family protein [Clostridiales bacterium]